MQYAIYALTELASLEARLTEPNTFFHKKRTPSFYTVRYNGNIERINEKFISYYDVYYGEVDDDENEPQQDGANRKKYVHPGE